MNEVKLLALDIDGTILTRDKELTDRTKNAIESASEAGIAVTLVTGRPFLGIPDELLTLNGLRAVISSNGAVTTDVRNHSVLRTANLDPKTALDIIRIPREYDLVYAVFVDGIGCCELEPFQRHLGMIHNAGIETYVRKSRRITYDMDRVIREAEHGVENIWLIAHDRSERDALNREISTGWKVRTVLTGVADIEIGSPGADKGLALSTLAETLHVEKREIMAIGDNHNDIGMLRAAGIAVAMGNADEEIKELADLITEDNNHNGAARVIEQLLREGCIREA